jgi:hypothetical protein
MSTAEMEEKKRLIIQEIQLVEEEWILRAIEKLLDMDDDIDLLNYNQDIEISLKQIAEGDSIVQEDLEEESKKW